MTNGNLFNGLLSGDREIVSTLYNTLLPKLESFFIKNQGNKLDARDILHESMSLIIISGNNGKLRAPQNIEAYIFSMCKYKWYAELKKRKTTIEVINEDSFTDIDRDSVQDEYIKSEQEKIRYTILERTFNLLSTTCQALLSLVKEGKSGVEIAKSLNMSNRNTVNRRKFACMDSWRKFIAKDKDIKLIS